MHYNSCMSLKIREEDIVGYVRKARKGCRKSKTRKAKNLFLTRFVEETGHNRKHAIRLLQKGKELETGRRGHLVNLPVMI